MICGIENYVKEITYLEKSQKFQNDPLPKNLMLDEPALITSMT